MNWNLLVAPICLLVGMFITLYVKEKSREVAKAEFTENIVAALAIFKVDLIKSMGEDFRREGECTLMMGAHDDRIDIIDKRLDTMDATILSILNRPIHG